MGSPILPEFELFIPQTIHEAAGLLSEYGGKMVVMAGGADLLVPLKSNGERVAATAATLPAIAAAELIGDVGLKLLLFRTAVYRPAPSHSRF